MISRRAALFGLLSAPAIIRTPGILMPVKVSDMGFEEYLTWLQETSVRDLMALTGSSGPIPPMTTVMVHPDIISRFNNMKFFTDVKPDRMFYTDDGWERA